MLKRLTMTSAEDTMMFLLILTPVSALAFSHTTARLSPDLRISLSAFHSCSPCIYVVVSCTVSGFSLFGNITHTTPTSMQFLFVGSNVCRQLPSDSTSRWTPLLLPNDTYCNDHSALALYSWNACLTNQKEYPNHWLGHSYFVVNWPNGQMAITNSDLLIFIMFQATYFLQLQ